MGLVIVTVCILAALVWSRSLTATATVLVTAGPVDRGVVIGEEDLVAAEVRGGHGLGLVTGDAVDGVVGRRALVDLPAGTPVVAAMFGELPRLSRDEALVGVALDRGQAPTDLAEGDRVGIVVVPDPVAIENEPARLLVDAALVWSIEPADEFEPRAVVTLGVPIGVATEIAAAHGVRLVRVGS